MILSDVLTYRKQQVEEALIDFFKHGINPYEAHIEEAMSYSLMLGGKRLRPILLLEMGNAFGLEDETLMDFACAIEMIHTYSLIHDDLPAMDDDDFRRNKPTNHKVYGEAIAILAGDGLLTHAFNLMIKKSLASNKIEYLKAMETIGRAAGYQGMIGGQVADMMCEESPGTKDDLDYLHTRKTGQLLTVPLTVAGILSKQPPSMIDALHELGINMGLIFQITDDLLDIEGDEAMLGKPIGSDQKNHKMTYPALHGIEKSKEKVDDLIKSCNQLIDRLPVACDFLKAYLSYLKKRQY